MGGMLASFGIEKGKPFTPDEKVKKALTKAIADGYNYLEFMSETPGYSFIKQWDDRQWMNIREPSSEGFVFDEGDYLLVRCHLPQMLQRYAERSFTRRVLRICSIASCASSSESNIAFLQGDSIGSALFLIFRKDFISR